MELERTFAIIKPDAVGARAVGAILLYHVEQNFYIEQMRKMRWYVEQAQEFYAEHKGKPFYPRLIEFMTSGPLVCMVLSGPGAVQRWRTEMGNTDPEHALCGTIRFKYGAGMPDNAAHGSESDESAAREIALFEKWTGGRV